MYIKQKKVARNKQYEWEEKGAASRSIDICFALKETVVDIDTFLFA